MTTFITSNPQHGHGIAQYFQNNSLGSCVTATQRAAGFCLMTGRYLAVIHNLQAAPSSKSVLGATGLAPVDVPVFVAGAAAVVVAIVASAMDATRLGVVCAGGRESTHKLATTRIRAVAFGAVGRYVMMIVIVEGRADQSYDGRENRKQGESNSAGQHDWSKGCAQGAARCQCESWVRLGSNLGSG